MITHQKYINTIHQILPQAMNFNRGGSGAKAMAHILVNLYNGRLAPNLSLGNAICVLDDDNRDAISIVLQGYCMYGESSKFREAVEPLVREWMKANV